MTTPNSNSKGYDTDKEQEKMEIIKNILETANGSWSDMIIEGFEAGEKFASTPPVNTNERLFTLDEMKTYGEFTAEREWNNHFGPVPNPSPTREQYFLEKFNIKL